MVKGLTVHSVSVHEVHCDGKEGGKASMMRLTRLDSAIAWRMGVSAGSRRKKVNRKLVV